MAPVPSHVPGIETGVCMGDAPMPRLFAGVAFGCAWRGHLARVFLRQGHRGRDARATVSLCGLCGGDQCSGGDRGWRGTRALLGGWGQAGKMGIAAVVKFVTIACIILPPSH